MSAQPEQLSEIKPGVWMATEDVLRLRRERDRYRMALVDIKATCDGRIAGEPKRASYLGISNFIRGVLRP